MSKRKANQYQPPNIELHAITEDLTLRVRLANRNVDGSAILMLKDGTFMECVLYKEAYAMEFKGENWAARYRAIYGDSSTDEELLESNESAKLFEENVSAIKLTHSELAGRDARQELKLQFVSWEDNVLKLKAERNVTYEIVVIQHTSMHLVFEKI